MPTPDELDRARELFETNEPRGLFYRVAAELIRIAGTGATTITAAEALATVLQTWNRSYYQFQHNGRFPEEHYRDIEALLARHEAALRGYRERSLASLDPQERAAVEALFGDFERVLGRVGAAKALHLLAPRFFPLWDNDIAAGYGCRLGPEGTNASRYWRFVGLVKTECEELGGEERWGDGLLKRLDEYNFYHHHKGWL